MNKLALAEKVAKLSSEYDLTFAGLGEMTSAKALEHHLYMLACYWSRLVGFFRNFSSEPESLVQDSMGACIQVASDRAHRMIGPDHLVHALWQEYWWRLTILLHKRPTTMDMINEAHSAFESCLAELNFDPWKDTRANWDKAGGNQADT